MVNEELLSVLGISKEEWKNINLIRLTKKYTESKSRIEKTRVPEEVKEKNIINLNTVYDTLKEVLRGNKKELEEVDIVENQEISIDNMIPKVTLPPPFAGIHRVKATRLPTPKKYLNKGVVLPPKDMGIELDLDEIIIPSEKKIEDVLVYTDRSNIVMLTVKRV